MSIKVITANMQGLADKVKRRQWFNYFRQTKADIICMQKTHCIKNRQKIWKAET